MELLTVGQVAALLSVGQRTVWRFRDSGRIPAPIALGGSVRWRRADLEQWISAGCPDCHRTGWRPESVGR
jgi:excisionase family DNA binding protein